MKAAVFQNPGQNAYDTIEEPCIEFAMEVILKVTASASCGSGLHNLSSAVPQKEPMTIRHKVTGIVEEAGKKARNTKRGDLERLFDKGSTLKMGQAPVLNYIDHLIEIVKTEKVKLYDIITYCLLLTQVEHAYKIFNEKEEDFVKVILDPLS
ncbi:alcohol dehydrogenase catalytic domain-containing protein [Mucilaginibacter sp. SMC90]|uniref:alcohol dehydrogenase catalytic domain-containing protein n=1 Tax=Mucilaginibacter sp. SMC90 TaxID=2929803 RepID=UPI001FB2DF9B|nr:alcohol dehydrogenase catalytic domain-containing protein [Mucilaginibacter sp. SMC90]UOE50998.1 alcohol dehydrogenase catalytic domain-containing protein [Mucilaginibacter sp. SMC90]